jgi:hypothetical protein
VLNVPIRKIRLDRTARGFHLVLIWAQDFSPLEIVAIQAILGSDPMREALNFMRARALEASGNKSEFWNILYSRKHDVSSIRGEVSL